MKWFDLVVIAMFLLAGISVSSYVWVNPADAAASGASHPELQIILTCVGVSVGTSSAYLALRQMLINSRNRAADQMWKRAESARDMLDTMFADDEAYGALRMLEDEPEELFEYEDDKFTVNLKEVRQGLEDWCHGTRPSRLVRRNFDSLASYLMRIYFFVRDGFVSLDVIQPVFKYHAMRMAQEKEAISSYFKRIGHDEALELLELFPEWRSPDQFGPVDMLQAKASARVQ